ncbi:hypothetical protein FQR65_LT02448 [Abscondita terminalis]|nr:hypothetical protein FQR65_LT02448 [Abscondita terminalis]
MAHSDNSLVNELLKFTKIQLVELLINHTLPENGIFSDNIHKLQKQISGSANVSEVKNKISDTDDSAQVLNMNGECNSSCNNISCLKVKLTSEYYIKENVVLNKLINHLEGEIILQKDYINLLKINYGKLENQDNLVNNVPSITNNMNGTTSKNKFRKHKENLTVLSHNVISETSTIEPLIRNMPAPNGKLDMISANVRDMSVTTIKPKIKHQQTSTMNTINGISIDSNNKIVNKDPNKIKPIRGSAQSSQIFQVAERTGFIFATGFAKSTTEDMVKTFLIQHVNCDFQIEKIASKSEFVSSFKIGMPLNLKSELMNGNVWPEEWEEVILERKSTKSRRSGFTLEAQRLVLLPYARVWTVENHNWIQEAQTQHRKFMFGQELWVTEFWKLTSIKELKNATFFNPSSFPITVLFPDPMNSDLPRDQNWF